MMHATAVDKGERGIQAMVPVGLDSGAPEFEWDPLLSTNIKTALGNGLALDYPPVQGLPALREAIAVIHRMEIGIAAYGRSGTGYLRRHAGHFPRLCSRFIAR